MTIGFYESFSAVFGLLLLCVPGYILVKIKLVNSDFIRALGKLVLYVCQPMLVITCLSKYSFSAEMGRDILFTAILSAILFIVFILFCLLVFLWQKPERRGVSVLSSVFGNIGFMAIPIIRMLLPGNALALVLSAISLAVFNIFIFSVGVFIITGDRKQVSFVKAFLNPTMIGVYIGFILFFIKVPLPTFISTPINILGDLCIGLSMIVLGCRIGFMKFSSLFTSLSAYITTIIKLIILPLVMLLLCMLMRVSETVTIIIYITSAMPSAGTVLMLSEVYNRDKESASRSIIISSVLSIVTIPLLMMLL